MSKEAIKYYDNKRSTLKTDRQSYESVWADIIDHCAPDLKGYLNLERKNDGQRNDDVIYDGTPAEYAQKCAAGMWAAISSPSRPWMRRKMRNKQMNEATEARQWLDEVTEIDYDTMQSSNFYQAMFTVYLHLVVIGTACMIIDQDYEDTINCTTLNVGEYWLGVNGKGKVDTVFRELKYMASQLKDKFGEDSLPQKVKDSITDNNPMGNEYTVVHVIEPDSRKVAPFKKPWVSAYYLEAENEDKFLQVRGYNRKPFAAPRWFTLSGETYGKMNPGRNMIGNCKQLQTMVYDFHEALQKVINPPLQGPSDTLGTNQISAIPGAYNPIDVTGPDNTIKPLFAVNPDLASMWQSIQDKKEQIASGFYIDLFMAVSMRMDKDMTAEEVRSIAGERMLALGPGLDNMHTELLNEVINIIFDYSFDTGLYPEPPEEIQGQETNVDYTSVLAQAQKMVDLSRIDQVLAYAERIAALTGQAPRKVNYDQILDEAGEMSGAPAGILYDDEAMRQMQEQAAQQQQTQEMAQAATVAADVGSKMAKMPMDQDTALSRMLGVQ
jgi:hypothetical protein